MRLTPSAWCARRGGLAALVDVLRQDSDAQMREAAAYSLWPLDDQGAVEPLLATVADADEAPGVRAQAAETLGYLGDRRAVPPLIAALADPAPEVRFWSAFALGGLADPRALPMLERLVAEDQAIAPRWWSVRREADDAAEAIQSMGRERDWPEVEALLETTGRSYRGLVALLGDGQLPPARRSIICRALGCLGDKRAVPALRAVLADPHEGVSPRAQAARALGYLGGKRAAPPLVGALLHDPATEVRRAAASALGQCGDARAVGPLGQAIGNEREDELVRWRAAEALGSLGGSEVLDLLVAAIARTDGEVQCAVVEALGEFGDPTVVAVLAPLAARSDPTLPGWYRGLPEAAAAAVINLLQRQGERQGGGG
jgi:HEAT repeat protein